jgi:hypothetical protein
MLLRKIFKKYVSKQDVISKRNAFQYWKVVFQKKYREQMKIIISCLKQFGDNIVTNAPKANYKEFKGLP